MGIFDFFKKKNKQEKAKKEKIKRKNEVNTQEKSEYETDTFQLVFSRKNCNDIAEIVKEEFKDIAVEDAKISTKEKGENESTILLNDKTIVSFEIKDNYEENIDQIFGMNNFYQGAIKGDESVDYLNNVFTQIKLSNFILHIGISKFYNNSNNVNEEDYNYDDDYFYEDRVYNIAKKLNAFVIGNMGFRLFNGNGEIMLDMYKEEPTATEFVCNITKEDIENYEIPEKYKDWILSHYKNFKNPLYKNKFIDDYSSFNWNMWLVSNGEKIAKTFVKAFKDEIINVYDKDGNKFDVDEKTKKIIMELKDDISMLVNIRADDYALEVSLAMANYFSDVKIKDDFIKNMVITQVHGFDCNVSIDIIMNKEKLKDEKISTKKLYDIMQKIEKVCEEHKAYFAMDINEIKRYDGKILISKKKGTQMTKDFRPFITTKRIDNFEMTEEDVKRMEKNIEKVRNENLPVYEGMYVSISEAVATIPEKEVIIKRMIAMIMTGVASELYIQAKGDDRDNIDWFINLYEEKYGFKEVLNEKEKEYIEKYTKEEYTHTIFNWRYECPAVLLWTLSLWELTDLSTICDVKGLLRFTKDNDMESLIEKSKLRSKDEIMDMLDYLYRLNWSAVELRIRPENHSNKKFPYDESIIHFRRLALEWLVQSEKSIEVVEREMHT